MRKLIFILIVTIIYTGGCLTGTKSYRANYNFGSIDKIAIVAVEGQIQNNDTKAQLADLFVMELLNKGYIPIPMNEVKAKMQESETGENLLSQNNSFTQIGQTLKVPAVMVIKVPYLNDEISITAQLYDTKDGGVLWMNQASGEIEQDEMNSSFDSKRRQENYLMDPLLMFQESQTPKPQEVPVKPGDRPLNPMELQRVKVIVSKVCSSLPSYGTNKKESYIISPTKTKTRTTSDW